jgi:hypothetical protein
MCNDDLAALLDSLERWYPRPFLDALAAAVGRIDRPASMP